MARTNGTPAALSAIQILEKMEEAAQSANRATDYTEKRRYTLRNDRFNRQAEMNVRVIHRADGTPKFDVLDLAGSEDVYNRVFKKLLEAEAELRRVPASERILRNANYEAELLGVETVDNRQCYLLEVHPRKKSKYLLQGRAWIDMATFNLVRLEGRPTASLSFWAGKPFIVQEFKEVSGAWIVAESRSTSRSRLLGTTELTIEHSDRQLLDAPSKVAAARAVRSNRQTP